MMHLRRDTGSAGEAAATRGSSLSSGSRNLISLDDSDSVLNKKREAKRLAKIERQRLSSSASACVFESADLDYRETDEQMRVRVMSHLLLGRPQNRVCQAFLREVEKKQDLYGLDNIDMLLRKTFKKANRQASKVVQKLPKGIRKLTSKELPPTQTPCKSSTTLLLDEDAQATRCRLLRMQKRNQDREKLMEEKSTCEVDQSSQSEVPQNVADSTFVEDEFHYLQEVRQHPERDMYSERIIDQERSTGGSKLTKPTFSSLPEAVQGKASPVLSGKKRAFYDVRAGLVRSCLKGLDLATPAKSSFRTSSIAASQQKKRKQAKINDTVEVYFYAKEDVEDSESDKDESEVTIESAITVSEISQNDSVVDDGAVAEPSFAQLVQSHLVQNREPATMSSSEVSFCSPAPPRTGKTSVRRKGVSFNNLHEPQSQPCVLPQDSYAFEPEVEKKAQTPPIHGKSGCEYLQSDLTLALSESVNLNCNTGTSTPTLRKRSQVNYVDRIFGAPARRCLFPSQQ